MKYTVKLEGRSFSVEVGDLVGRPIHVLVDGEPFEVWPESPTAEAAEAAPVGDTRRLAAPPAPASVSAAAAAAPGAAGADAVLAPIPGVIVSIAVQPGDTVATGQELCVLEAMKMKSPIRAPRAGVVGAVRVIVGQQVKHKEALVDYAR